MKDASMQVEPDTPENTPGPIARTPTHAVELERQQARRSALKRDLATRFPEPVEILLEPGCGHGHWLVDYAGVHTGTRCLGLDLLGERVAKANAKVQRAGLANVAFLKSELTEFLEALPEHVTFGRIVFLFPDPWPKKRHFRRRMIQPELLTALATRTPVGQLLHFRTDDDSYFQWTCEHLQSHPQWEIDTEIAWPFERETVFQRKMGSFQSVSARRNETSVS